MGLYIKRDDVEQRLFGKVKFTDDPEDKNALVRTLLDKLIDDAEAQVEFDLSPRYMAPFQVTDGSAFTKLPRSTQRFIKNVCELMGQIRVLETSFGRGSSIGGSQYSQDLQKRYDEYMKKAIDRFTDADGRFGAFKFPPLMGIMLAPHNSAADDGFGGMVLTHSRGDGQFPLSQIQDPSETYWNGVIDSLDGPHGSRNS